MLVHESLEQSALRFPDKAALVFQDEKLTFSSLDKQANRLAHAFIDNGLQKGERSAIFLENCPESVVSIYATLKAGAVFCLSLSQV